MAQLRQIQPDLIKRGIHLSSDALFAEDAQPTLITSPNAGVPWQMTNIIDPEMIRVLVAPMNAVDILGGETKKGDWTVLSVQFPVGEATGFTSSYGDYNNNGNVGANFNYVPRQSYHFQTVTRWGERETAIYGAGNIDYAAQLNLSSALILAKFFNKSYFFGINSLQNYGLLNDPSLSAPITPATKAAGGTAWTNATPPEVNTDIQLLFSQLQTQMGGNLNLDSPMTLAMSPASQVFLLNTNIYGVSVRDLLMKNFSNLKIKTAPEYATTGGKLVQLIVDSVDGVDTAYAGFTEKLRAHAVIQNLSSFMQKKSGGTWGAIIRRPIAIAQMLGV